VNMPGLTNTTMCQTLHAKVLDGTGMLVLMHKSSRHATDVPDATNKAKQQHDMSPALHLQVSPLCTWAARCNTWLLIELMLKGVVLSFFSYLYVADFILVPCCQNDEVAGMNLEIISFAVIFAAMLADIGILLIALVVRQPCICKRESVRRAQNTFAMQLSAEEGTRQSCDDRFCCCPLPVWCLGRCAA